LPISPDTSLLDGRQREALRQVVENHYPVPAIHGIMPLIELATIMFDKFRVSISKQTLSCGL
jgi:hypothetical protein